MLDILLFHLEQFDQYIPEINIIPPLTTLQSVAILRITDWMKCAKWVFRWLAHTMYCCVFVVDCISFRKLAIKINRLNICGRAHRQYYVLIWRTEKNLGESANRNFFLVILKSVLLINTFAATRNAYQHHLYRLYSCQCICLNTRWNIVTNVWSSIGYFMEKLIRVWV